MDLETLKASSLFPVGEENRAYAAYFDGTSYLNMLSLDQVARGQRHLCPRLPEPLAHPPEPPRGAGRSSWSPPAGGYYQEWGQPPRELHPGDVVNIPRPT